MAGLYTRFFFGMPKSRSGHERRRKEANRPERIRKKSNAKELDSVENGEAVSGASVRLAPDVAGLTRADG
jgi:hypothetical protein